MDSTTMNRLIIIGASGHGKVVADIAKLVGYTDIVFLDDDSNISECAGYLVIGKVSSLSDLEGDVFVAVGNASIRKKLILMANDLNVDLSYIKFKEDDDDDNFLLNRLFLTLEQIEGYDDNEQKENPVLFWLKNIVNKCQFFNSPNMLL